MASTAVFAGGRHDDWIELYNSGKKTSLEGWYLSNDPFNLQRWAFPKGSSIAKGGYLVIYCVGSDTVESRINGALYADFKISASGETLYLTDAEGNTTTVTFGAQYGNVSSGIPKGGDGWHYLETATKGKENAATGYDARAQEPVIETAAGFYDKKVNVVITSPDDCEIRYTTDGSEPTRKSTKYTGPITVKKTTVIRARAFGKTLLGSTTAGATFFIDDPSAVPVVSMYTDNDYLYSNAKGVMVKGTGSIANYDRETWEYPMQIEFFDENGARQLVQMGTFKISGHSSRSQKQKSFAIYARKAYGAETFDYPFFENRDYTSYSALLLRSTNNDGRSCRLRDAVLTEVSNGLGLYYQSAKPIILYLNGSYFGHYNLREKVNKDSLAQWEGITDKKVIEGVDILECVGFQKSQIIHGDNADWIALMNFCKENDLHDPEKLQYVLDRLDVDSMFNYVIFSALIGNYDSYNVRMYRFPEGKWKFMLHDVEAGCMSYKEAPLSTFLKKKTEKAGNFPHWALAALLELPEYKDYFLRRTAEIIESNFLYDIQSGPIAEWWTEQVGALLPRHIAKFKNLKQSDWNANVRAFKNYLRLRPKKVIGYICEQLHVSTADQEKYFAETLRLLQQHNTV